MKNIKKSIVIMMTVCLMLLGTLTAISAVNVQEGTTSKKLTYNLGKISSLDIDDLTVSDPDGIVKSAKISGVDFKSSSSVTKEYTSTGVTMYSDGLVTSKVYVTVTLKSSAQPGDSATITLVGGYTGSNGSYVDGKKWSETVTIVEKGQSSTPSKPAVKLDLTELKKQISIAESLNEKEYTSTSWKVLADELNDGKAALKADTQAKVDAAAKELADAIAQLVKMDWSRLQDAINKGNALIEDEEMGKLWKDLLNALNNGSLLLGSNDQDAVNAAADQILAALEALKAYLGMDDDAIIVSPGEEFCNISIHNVWPILFFISLAINAVLGVLLVKGKKNKLNDNTPMVNYDISDDDK